VRGIFLMANKAMFDVTKLDLEKYSKSLGLAIHPRVRFLQKHEKKQAELDRERQLKAG